MIINIEDILGFDYRVNYDLEKLKTLPAVSNKILELQMLKKQVLEEFKDSDETMPDKTLYETTLNSINQVYNGFIAPLETRRRKILAEIVSDEENARKLKEESILKRAAIKMGFRLKSARYENRLFGKRCKVAHRASKAALRERYKVPVPPKMVVVPPNKFIITKVKPP